jgi:hypothetical protein
MNFCPVESDLNRYLTSLDKGEAREVELKQQYPLSDFQDAAVAELLTEGFMQYGRGLTHAEDATAAAERLAMFKAMPHLMPSKYATDGLVRDEGVVREFVECAMEEIQERLQEEKINDPWVWNGV